MTIRSNPPGAIVYVDNEEIGATPISTGFTYYGTRDIRLVKDGCETLTVQQPIPSPWYQIPPLDFITENLVPAEIRDHRTLNYQLAPQRMVPPDELRARAEDLRGRVGVTGMFAALPPDSGRGAPVGLPGSHIAPPPAAPGPTAPYPAFTVPPPDNGPGFQTLPHGGRPASY